MLLLPGESSDATDATDATDAAVIRDAPEMHQYECSDPTTAVFRVLISSSYQKKKVFLIARRDPYIPKTTTHPPLRNPNPQSSTPAVYRFLGGRCLHQETGGLFLHLCVCVCVCVRARACGRSRRLNRLTSPPLETFPPLLFVCLLCDVGACCCFPRKTVQIH